MYANLLFKPPEIVLYQPVIHGGLSLTSTRIKALASLLRTFLELSANPKYIPSLFLTILFRVHVMGEDLPGSALPPYYNKEFFELIIAARTAGHDVTQMSTKQWYSFLLEHEVTMTVVPDQPPQLIACRAEEESPHTDWASLWTLSRMPSLGDEAASHAFKLGWLVGW